MDYTDYIADTPYDNLPEVIQASISKADYEEQRLIVLALGATNGSSAELPPPLREAYLTGVKNKPKSMNYAWLAAAGWLLLLGSLALFHFSPQPEKVVYQIISSPVPAQKIITTTDTLYLEQTIQQVFYDTVFLTIDTPPQFVYLRDTVYAPSPAPLSIDSVYQSRSAAESIRNLDLLISTK